MVKRTFAFFLAAAVVVMFCSTGWAQSKDGWPKSVTIGAAPIGGTYFVWAGGFAKLLNDKMGIPGNVESTGGPIHNVQLIESNSLDFGMITNAPAAEGWAGDGWAKGKKFQNQRAILPLYTTYFQMYSLASTGIKSIKDFGGKSVGVGPIGGTPATYWPKIVETAGVKPKRIVNASSSDLNSQLKDGMLDASGNSVGLPWVTITEVETTHDASVYGVPNDVADKFIEKFPYFAKGSVPKGTYKSNKDHDIETLTLWNFMVVPKNMPEEFVYEVIKNTFANIDILIAAHSSATEVKPENVIYSPVPLHPGAVKFYQEKGIKIPERLLPPK